eukprot:gene30177-34132_t
MQSFGATAQAAGGDNGGEGGELAQHYQTGDINVSSSSSPSQTSSAQITVRDAVIDFMRRVGMRSVFGNPGSTELPMFRNFPDDFRYVLGLQEA